MIKSKLIILAFYLGVALLHYGIATLFPQPFFNKDLVLIYAALTIITFVGSTLLHFSFKSENEGAFAGMFMVFTTVQMLAVMSLSAYFIFGGFNYSKAIVIQLIILFFVGLVFQTLYFIRLGKKKS